MRVLITGATGALGRDLQPAFEGHEVVACHVPAFDVGDRDAVMQAVGQVGPDVVVHTAAWTDVDACEGDPDRAMRVNALGTRHVAEAAAMTNARLCYVSTDYVFDGQHDRPYTEWDHPNPLSVYGRSKLAGESEVERLLGASATVVRTSWLCGRHGRNFVKTILQLASDPRRDALTVVDDQRGCPTFTEDLAVMIRTLVVSRRSGLYHVTNQGVTTWFELAQAALAAAGLDPLRVQPTSTADLRPPRPAPRPKFSVLDNAVLRLSGLPLLPEFHEPLERLVKELTAA